MRDETGRPQSEMDVLKFYIWLMVVMTVVLAGFFWTVWRDLEDTRQNIKLGQTLSKEFAERQAEIQGMLRVYTTNKEDAARDAPQLWFSTIWQRKGINTNSVNPGSWTSSFVSKGKYTEERIDMGFNPRAPLPRQQIAEFCHEVEKSSTRQRVLELDIRRVDRENFDKDEWTGKATIGFRHTPDKLD
jgi:hypothetical protein